MDRSEVNAANEALSRFRTALDKAKKRLDDGALPRGEVRRGKTVCSEPPPGSLPLRIERLLKINRLLRIVTVMLLCGLIVAAIAITLYHATRMRAMTMQVSEMSRRIASEAEAREHASRRHAREVERLRGEIQSLRGEGRKGEPRKRFLGIF